MLIVQSILRMVTTILTGHNTGVLAEISVATGVPTWRLAGMTRSQIVETIRDAGIPLSTIPTHIENALGLVRAS